MKQDIRKFLIAAFLLTLATPASAEHLMVLFPKGRAHYQENFDKAGAHYQARAQSYIDDVYTYGGERNFSDDTSSSLLTGEELSGMEVTPDGLLDPSSSQLLNQDPPALPETASETSAE